MAKNRKNQSAAIRFGPAVKAFLLCAVLAGCAIGYVAQKGKIDELGRQIRAREKRLAELQDQNKKFRDQLQVLRSPKHLEERVRDLKLGLAQPLPGQVRGLPEPLPPPGMDMARLPAGLPSVAALAP